MRRFRYFLTAWAAWAVMAGGACGLELTPYTALGPYPSNGIPSASMDFSMTAIGATMEATFSCTGKELLLAYNPAIGSASLCIASVTDEYGAKGDIAETISGASVAAFYFGDRRGWDLGSGVSITSATSGLQLAVLRLPQVFRPVSAATTASFFKISNVLGPYPTTTQILANHLELQQNVAGIVGSATIPISGREVLIAHNVSSTTDTAFRILGGGIRNKYNRLVSVPNNSNSYTLGPGEWACWVLSTIEGFANTDGHCWWMGSTTDLRLGVARLNLR